MKKWEIFACHTRRDHPIKTFWFPIGFRCCIEFSENHSRTRMHSSRMRTARLLTVSQHALRGVSAQGGVCPGGSVRGEGVCQRRSAPRGGSAIPPVDGMTACVKTLPFRRLRLRAVKIPKLNWICFKRFIKLRGFFRSKKVAMVRPSFMTVWRQIYPWPLCLDVLHLSQPKRTRHLVTLQQLDQNVNFFSQNNTFYISDLEICSATS